MESYIFFSVFLVPRNPLKPASRVTSRRSVGDGPEGPADAFQWANKSSRRSGGPASILGSQIPARKPTVFGWCEKNLVNNQEKTKISSKKGLIERKPLGFVALNRKIGIIIGHPPKQYTSLKGNSLKFTIDLHEV